METFNTYRTDLWALLEKYSETPLFRDWNDARVSKALQEFGDELVELHERKQTQLYRLVKNP